MTSQAIRRRDRLESLNAAATSGSREHAESLLRGIDALTRRFVNLPEVPLDVLDRAERIVVAWHSANLLRVACYSDERLTEADE
jgi:hypothetical protein